MAAGLGSCTFSNNSRVTFRAGCRPRPRCSCTASVTWLPQVKTGLSEVMGSWKIMAMPFPRTIRSWRGVSVLIFTGEWPSGENRISPETYLAGGLPSNCRIASAVTDFPEPDSPAIPVISPRLMVSVIPFMAVVVPPAVSKSIRRSLIWSKGCMATGLRRTIRV